MPVAPETIEAFVAEFRKRIPLLIDDLSEEFGEIEGASELFSSPTVTAALLLSALDYCAEQKLRPDQFVHTLRVLATKFEVDMCSPPAGIADGRRT